MTFNQTDSPHAKLTEQLIGFGMAVHREHGPGLDENTYENSMCIEMSDHRISFTQQEVFPIYYKGKYVSRLIIDLIVDDKVVLENKVASAITDLHIAQLLSYLAVTRLDVGLILNFGKPSLEVRRVINKWRQPPPEKSPQSA